MTVGYLYRVFFVFFLSLFPDRKVEYQAAQDRSDLLATRVNLPSPSLRPRERAALVGGGVWPEKGARLGKRGSGESEMDWTEEGMGTGNSHL